MDNKFKVTVLGSGGAFATMEQGNSAFLVDYKDHRILIDCGSTVPYVLRDEMGIPLQSITDIIITHCHADHAGGLEMILHACRWIGGGCKPTLWAGSKVLAGLSHTLRILSYEKDTDSVIPPSVKHFWEHHVSREGDFLGGLALHTASVEHVGAMPATSVRLGPLFVSGDTNAPVMPPDDVELVFHEAEFGFSSGVHCPVEDLDIAFRGLSSDGYHPLRSKTWLYHSPPSIVDAPEGFAGILGKGQVFELEVP